MADRFDELASAWYADDSYETGLAMLLRRVDAEARADLAEKLKAAEVRASEHEAASRVVRRIADALAVAGLVLPGEVVDRTMRRLIGELLDLRVVVERRNATIEWLTSAAKTAAFCLAEREDFDVVNARKVLMTALKAEE